LSKLQAAKDAAMNAKQYEIGTMIKNFEVSLKEVMSKSVETKAPAKKPVVKAKPKMVVKRPAVKKTSPKKPKK